MLRPLPFLLLTDLPAFAGLTKTLRRKAHRRHRQSARLRRYAPRRTKIECSR